MNFNNTNVRTWKIPFKECHNRWIEFGHIRIILNLEWPKKTGDSPQLVLHVAENNSSLSNVEDLTVFHSANPGSNRSKDSTQDASFFSAEALLESFATPSNVTFPSPLDFDMISGQTNSFISSCDNNKNLPEQLSPNRNFYSNENISLPTARQVTSSTPLSRKKTRSPVNATKPFRFDTCSSVQTSPSNASSHNTDLLSPSVQLNSPFSSWNLKSNQIFCTCKSLNQHGIHEGTCLVQCQLNATNSRTQENTLKRTENQLTQSVSSDSQNFSSIMPKKAPANAATTKIDKFRTVDIDGLPQESWQTPVNEFPSQMQIDHPFPNWPEPLGFPSHENLTINPNLSNVNDEIQITTMKDQSYSFGQDDNSSLITSSTHKSQSSPNEMIQSVSKASESSKTENLPGETSSSCPDSSLVIIVEDEQSDAAISTEKNTQSSSDPTPISIDPHLLSLFIVKTQPEESPTEILSTNSINDSNDHEKVNEPQSKLTRPNQIEKTVGSATVCKLTNNSRQNMTDNNEKVKKKRKKTPNGKTVKNSRVHLSPFISQPISENFKRLPDRPSTSVEISTHVPTLNLNNGNSLIFGTNPESNIVSSSMFDLISPYSRNESNDRTYDHDFTADPFAPNSYPPLVDSTSLNLNGSYVNPPNNLSSNYSSDMNNQRSFNMLLHQPDNRTRMDHMRISNVQLTTANELSTHSFGFLTMSDFQANDLPNSYQMHTM